MHAAFRGYNGQTTAKTGIVSVGYAPNSRPPDLPPLSVTPLILALRAPIRHIFAIIPVRGKTSDLDPRLSIHQKRQGGGQGEEDQEVGEKEWAAEK